MIQPLLLATLVMAATWDAWRWYVGRVWDSPEEALSLILTVVFLGVLGAARRRKLATRGDSDCLRAVSPLPSPRVAKRSGGEGDGVGGVVGTNRAES